MKTSNLHCACLVAGFVLIVSLGLGRPADAIVNENCGCHSRIMEEKKFPHLPVREGKCALCHKPSGKKHPRFKKEAFIFTDNGKSGLCNECHSRKDSMKFVHGPVAKGDCLLCHDVHQSDNKAQLKVPLDQLCYLCHPKPTFDRIFPHAPISGGNCTGCHDPHQSDVKYMLKGDKSILCFLCHQQTKFTGTSAHKPVAEGKCDDCHTTHGTNLPHLLKQNFPEPFYLPFEKSNYALCFSCHNNQLADEQRTDTLTNFRNGYINLHFIHVNKAGKGRSCKTCHDPHASSQYRLISSKISGFGKWSIPIRYLKTDTGGTCVVGCHKHKTYNRIEPVINP